MIDGALALLAVRRTAALQENKVILQLSETHNYYSYEYCRTLSIAVACSCCMLAAASTLLISDVDGYPQYICYRFRAFVCGRENCVQCIEAIVEQYNAHDSD